MTDSKEVPNTDSTKRAGYDFDPYSDPVQLGDIHSPMFPFHNYRQVHISEVAFGMGFEAPTPKDIPKCPPLWQDVQHYWIFSSIVGYMACEFNTRYSVGIKVGVGVGAIGVYQYLVNSGILTSILKMIGV